MQPSSVETQHTTHDIPSIQNDGFSVKDSLCRCISIRQFHPGSLALFHQFLPFLEPSPSVPSYRSQRPPGWEQTGGGLTTGWPAYGAEISSLPWLRVMRWKKIDLSDQLLYFFGQLIQDILQDCLTRDVWQLCIPISTFLRRVLELVKATRF